MPVATSHGRAACAARPAAGEGGDGGNDVQSTCDSGGRRSRAFLRKRGSCRRTGRGQRRPSPVTDVLDRLVMQSALAAKTLLIGMAKAGDKFVAVGPRGHIVVTADGGQT